MKRASVYLVVAIVVALWGCRENRSADGIGLESVADQQFSYHVVKQKVGELKPGMTEQQVLFILGTPAGKEGNL